MKKLSILFVLFFVMNFNSIAAADSIATVDSIKCATEIKNKPKYNELMSRYAEAKRKDVVFKLNPIIRLDGKKRKYVNFELSLNGHTDYIVAYYINYKRFGFIIDMK